MKNLEALEFDKFLHSVRDVHVPILILETNIARLEVHVSLMLGLGAGCRFGVVVVAEEDVGPGYPDFAFLTGWDFVAAVRRHEFDYLIGEGGTDGAETVIPFFLYP